MNHPHRNLRILGTLILALAIAVLSYGVAGRPAPALAQTVPTATPLPEPVTVPAEDATGTTDLGTGTFTLTEGVTSGLGNVTFDNISTGEIAQLPPPRAGYTVISAGISLAATDEDGDPVTLLPRGVTVCIRLPAGATAYDNLRVAYFDVRPEINRWVLLATVIRGEFACTRLRIRIPATFALLAK